MKKWLSYLMLVFALLSLVFYIVLIFFRNPFPLYGLMSWQDALDVLTPLVLICLYWILFRYASSSPSRLWEEILFLVLAVLWVDGHGMHLAANSINNLIGKLAEQQVIDLYATDIYRLVDFFDENLGHMLWHLGFVGLAFLLIYREWRSPAGAQTVWWASLLGGILFGFTCFSIFLEGGTVVLGLIFSILVVLLGLLWGRKKLGDQPVLAFFFVSCLVALLLFSVWGFRYGGFPQPSEVGLI